MGWVEVYKYDLGFCVLHVMIHAQPNGIDSHDKYTMAAHRIPKLKLSIEKLTKDGTLNIIKYPNFFTIKERTFAQKFI